LIARQIQHALSSLLENTAAEAFAVSLANPLDTHSQRHLAHHLSSRGDAHSFGTTPSDANTSHSNDNFSIMICRRLHLPLPHQQEEEASRCPLCHKANVDHWGDHAVTCNSTTKHRTSLWHDPLVRASHFVCLTTGRRTKIEVYGHQVLNNLRPDVVVFGPGCLPDIVCDVRTCNPTAHPQSSTQEGFAADQAAKAKNRKWEPSCHSQGDRFVALAFASGGQEAHGAEDSCPPLAPAAQRLRHRQQQRTGQRVLARRCHLRSGCGSSSAWCRGSLPAAGTCGATVAAQAAGSEPATEPYQTYSRSRTLSAKLRVASL